MKTRNIPAAMAGALGMAVLILDSRTAISGASEGIVLCLYTVIPSLFPFFMISILLTSSLSGFRFRWLCFLGNLLGVPEGCESLLIPAFLGGYPVGAQCIGQAFSAGQLKKRDAERLLSFCGNAGPSFLFGMVAGLFSSAKTVWMIWMIQITGALTAAAFFYEATEDGAEIQNEPVSAAKALSSAVTAMANVCGWVILFRTIISVLDRWVLWLFPKWIRISVAGFLELSNGCTMLSQIPDERLRFLLCCGFLSFGGICVLLQTDSVSCGLTLKSYIQGKLLSAAVCVFLAGFYGTYLLLILLTWLGAVLLYVGLQQKKSSIPHICSV